MQPKPRTFTIRFSERQYSPAIQLPIEAAPDVVIKEFGLLSPRPTIFITGGASNMSDEDINKTRELIDRGIAAFASRHNITVIDGGTEAGVMQMLGESRRRNGYKFPLVGVTPLYKVNYPGYIAPDPEAELEAGHSHFVLVEGDQWGDESQMIVNLTRAISAQQQPMLGILINGGKIAERDVYLATTTGDNSIPMLIVDGSGRTADTISTAFKTQQTDSRIIQAIIKGGDIHLTALHDGVPALLEELARQFQSIIE